MVEFVLLSLTDFDGRVVFESRELSSLAAAAAFRILASSTCGGETGGKNKWPEMGLWLALIGCENGHIGMGESGAKSELRMNGDGSRDWIVMVAPKVPGPWKVLLMVATGGCCWSKPGRRISKDGGRSFSSMEPGEGMSPTVSFATIEPPMMMVAPFLSRLIMGLKAEPLGLAFSSCDRMDLTRLKPSKSSSMSPRSGSSLALAEGAAVVSSTSRSAPFSVGAANMSRLELAVDDDGASSSKTSNPSREASPLAAASSEFSCAILLLEADTSACLPSESTDSNVDPSEVEDDGEPSLFGALNPRLLGATDEWSRTLTIEVLLKRKIVNRQTSVMSRQAKFR